MNIEQTLPDMIKQCDGGKTEWAYLDWNLSFFKIEFTQSKVAYVVFSIKSVSSLVITPSCGPPILIHTIFRF